MLSHSFIVTICGRFLQYTFLITIYPVYSCSISPISHYYNIIMVVITTRCDVNDILFEINTWLLFVILLFLFLMKNTKSTFEPQEHFFYYPPACGRSGFEPGRDRPNLLEQIVAAPLPNVQQQV